MVKLSQKNWKSKLFKKINSVDKFLPQRIAAIAADNEHWVPYMEKAYAKKYQTYDAITGGWGCWGLTDLTGGIAIKTKVCFKNTRKRHIRSF